MSPMDYIHTEVGGGMYRVVAYPSPHKGEAKLQIAALIAALAEIRNLGAGQVTLQGVHPVVFTATLGELTHLVALDCLGTPA